MFKMKLYSARKGNTIMASFFISLMTSCRVIKKFIFCLMLFLNINSGYSAGFAVLEQSVQGLGVAYAGGTAGGEDISTIFYNPAGLSEYTGTEILSGGHLVLPKASFKVESSSDILSRPLRGGEGLNASENVLIPNLYLATDLTESLRLGLGITVPFGLGTKFDPDWQGRYEAIDSQLKTIDFNPVISYAFNDKFTLGFGVSAQYIDIELSNAIDFGTLCFGKLGAAACSGLGISPQTVDGRVELKATGWSWGYNAGILFKPVQGLRLGIAYRSKIDHSVKGNAEFQVPKAAKLLTASGAFRNTGIEAESYVPANLSIGAIYEANKNWAILFNLTWTEWKRLDKLTIRFNNSVQPPTTLNLDFKNTLRTSLGFIYHINNAWSFRSGFAYDESPVRTARTRTFRIPDSDRYWLTAGLSYRPSPSLNFNIGYAHVFIKEAKIERENSFGHKIKGIFESQIDIVSAELQLSF